MVVLVCGRGGCGVWDLTVIDQSCSVLVAGTPTSMSGMLWLEKWSPPLSESLFLSHCLFQYRGYSEIFTAIKNILLCWGLIKFLVKIKFLAFEKFCG